MKLREVLAISGQPGLYTFVAQSQRGIIVEAVSDKRRSTIPNTSKVSALKEISIFTISDDLPLSELFTKIQEYYKGEQAISHKESDEKLKEAFAKVLPKYDPERVRVSDMKKIFSWYNILTAAGLESFAIEDEEQSQE